MGSPLLKIALVGRPNVGKSALFNRLCGKRISIVDEQEGVTRDRLYAETEFFGRTFCLIDTGGIDATATHPFNEQVKRQSELAIEEADAAILVVDGRLGPTDLDREVAKILLRKKKPAVVAINKIDQRSDETLLHQFYSLCLPKMVAVSATQGFQIAELMEAATSLLRKEPAVEVPMGVEEIDPPLAMPSSVIRVAIAGRPNVGKSTILNCLLGQERSIVSPIAGTTRDAIDAPITVDGKEYLLIDTAGIRRKKAEHDVVDKFAAVRTKEAIERSDVVLLVLDSYEGLTAQEKRIACEIEEMGKSCILLFNKWDLVHDMRMEHALRGVHEDVPFLAHCPTIFLSATEGRNLDKIFPEVQKVYADRFHRVGTGELNQFIERCVQRLHPPMLTGKRLRIYYMAQVEVAPPKFVFFVNRPDLMAPSYKKYLINQFRDTWRFAGCPLLFDLRGKKSLGEPPR